MNTPHLTTPLAADTLWHTNWGFCVRTILAGQTTDFFLDSRIAGSHRDYADSFIDGSRQEHHNVFDRHGTPNLLVPEVIAHVKARIIATGDDIPLDPEGAISTVQKLWNARIERAKPEDRPGLAEYRDKLCTEIQKVLHRDVSSVVAIEGIIGVCSALKRPQG